MDSTPLSVVAGGADADLNNLDYIENLRIFSFSLRSTEEGEYIKYKHQSINWVEHIEKFVYATKPEKWYRMMLVMLNYLIDELHEVLTVSIKHSMSSTLGGGTIHPEVIVAVSRQSLGCMDRHTSLADYYGTSDASVQYIIEQVMLWTTTGLDCIFRGVPEVFAGTLQEAARRYCWITM